jgi:Sec-independent protein translocase protein TatA
MSDLGKGIKSFRKGMAEEGGEIEKDKDETGTNTDTDTDSVSDKSQS